MLQQLAFILCSCVYEELYGSILGDLNKENTVVSTLSKYCVATVALSMPTFRNSAGDSTLVCRDPGVAPVTWMNVTTSPRSLYI